MIVTIADIARSLGWRQKTAQMRQLDSLAPAERQRVEAVLSAMPPSASIDIAKVIESLRLEAADTAFGLSPAEREAMLAEIEAEMARLDREAAARGISPGSGDYYALLLELDSEPSLSCPASPAKTDEEPDDEPRRRRRSARRRRSLRRDTSSTTSERETPISEHAAPAQTPRSEGPRPFLHGRLFGAGDSERPLGCPVDCDDFERWRNPALPDWLSQVRDEDVEATPT